MLRDFHKALGCTCRSGDVGYGIWKFFIPDVEITHKWEYGPGDCKGRSGESLIQVNCVAKGVSYWE